jgi:protein-S-isoprenylcysteine O-methyltransferase Ste14
MSKKKQERYFWWGLILGLLTGILGNLFVSYLMKAYDYLDFSFEVWAASAAICFLLILLFVWYMWRQSKGNPEE